MGTLGEALEELDARLFVGRQQELALFRDWLASTDSATAIIHVWGPGGSGKSALLRAFGRIARSLDREVIAVDGQDIRPEVADLAQALGSATLDAAIERLNTSRAVLLLDTFEQLVDLTRVLQREVLPRLSSAVRVVIAGRQPLGLAWGPWRPVVRDLALGGLSATEVRDYLNRRGVLDPALIDQAVARAGGLPLALSLVSDLVLQQHVRNLDATAEWHRLVQSLVQELLQDIDEPVLRELLEAAAILRQFDEATLAEVTGRDDVGDAFARMCRLSIVRPGPHGLSLHDDVRHILAQDLRWRQPERYREYRVRALDTYRRRMRDASSAEREWLLGERLALWENAFIQRMLFTEAEIGRVWLDSARAEDVPELLRVWSEWVDQWLATQMRVHFDRQVDHGSMQHILSHRGARIRVARDADNRVVGFSSAIAVCEESIAVLEMAPGLSATLHAFLRSHADALPVTPAQSNIYYFVNLAHDNTDPVATQQALIREVFGLFARGGKYLVATPLPAYKELFTSLGFERLADSEGWFWSDEQPEEGFFLDLTRVGFDAWIDAIVAGRQPPRALGVKEIETLLWDEVLPNWHDDVRLADCALADSAPELRSQVEKALTERMHDVDPERARALKAVQETYIRRRASHDRIAEQLGVSRSTFYRLLRRGTHELAVALDAARHLLA